MKQVPEFTKAQEHMKPGVLSSSGFLGSDTRTLSEIIEADEEMVTRLGFTFDQLTTQLKVLLQAGKAGLGDDVTVQGKWLVRVDEVRGSIASPFDTDGMYSKVNVHVEKLDGGKPSGKKLIYNDLCIHLIEKYHFMQGHGSLFRTDPKGAKEVLDL